MDTMLPDGRVITVDDSERQPCEIWSRVMGYYRPISAYNIGKRQEYEDRVFFSEVKGTGAGLEPSTNTHTLAPSQAG